MSWCKRETTDISAALKVGATTETVQVSADQAPSVETTTSSIGSTIDMKAIEDLPTSRPRSFRATAL